MRLDIELYKKVVCFTALPFKADPVASWNLECIERKHFWHIPLHRDSGCGPMFLIWGIVIFMVLSTYACYVFSGRKILMYLLGYSTCKCTSSDSSRKKSLQQWFITVLQKNINEFSITLSRCLALAIFYACWEVLPLQINLFHIIPCENILLLWKLTHIGGNWIYIDDHQNHFYTSYNTYMFDKKCDYTHKNIHLTRKHI